MCGEGDQQGFVCGKIVENGAEKAWLGGGGAQILWAETGHTEKSLEAFGILRQPSERSYAQVLRFGFACG